MKISYGGVWQSRSIFSKIVGPAYCSGAAYWVETAIAVFDAAYNITWIINWGLAISLNRLSLVDLSWLTHR